MIGGLRPILPWSPRLRKGSIGRENSVGSAYGLFGQFVSTVHLYSDMIRKVHFTFFPPVNDANERHRLAESFLVNEQERTEPPDSSFGLSSNQYSFYLENPSDKDNSHDRVQRGVVVSGSVPYKLFNMLDMQGAPASASAYGVVMDYLETPEARTYCRPECGDLKIRKVTLSPDGDVLSTTLEDETPETSDDSVAA